MKTPKDQKPSSLHHLLLLVVERTLFPLMLLMCTPNLALGDETAPALDSVSAAEFVTRVKTANPELLLRQTAVDIAAAEVTAAQHLPNPTVAYDREEVFNKGTGFAENQVRLEVPVEISGRRGLLVESAKRAVRAEALEAVAARINFISDCLKIYYRTAAWRQRLKLLQSSKQSLSALLQSVRDRVVEGDSSGYDLSRVELEVASLGDLIADTERELARGHLLLGALAGAPAVPLHPSDELRPVSISAADLPSGTGSDHPLLDAAQHEITAHELARNAAGRRRVPSLTLTGGMKTAPDGNNTLFGYVAGIALSLPFFDAGQGERERAAAEIQRSRAALATIENQIATSIAMAQKNLRHVTVQEKQFETEQLPRIEKLIETAEFSFKEGERPVFELLDAHRTVLSLRLRHLDLLLNAHLSLVDLNAALGREPGVK